MAAVTSDEIRECSLVFGQVLSNQPVSPSTVQTPPLNHADALNTPSNSKSFITHHENYSFTLTAVVRCLNHYVIHAAVVNCINH